jgi:hypothetical protein
LDARTTGINQSILENRAKRKGPRMLRYEPLNLQGSVERKVVRVLKVALARNCADAIFVNTIGDWLKLPRPTISLDTHLGHTVPSLMEVSMAKSKAE